MDAMTWLAIPLFPHLLSPIGIGLLLSSFGLLLATGVLTLIKLIGQTIHNYFSTHQRMQRRLLFMGNKQQQLSHLFNLKAAKITYLADLKRNRLFRKNNRKHLRVLSKAINQDLSAIRKNLSANDFKRLHAEITHCKNKQNIEALLKLQQHITSITRT